MIGIPIQYNWVKCTKPEFRYGKIKYHKRYAIVELTPATSANQDTPLTHETHHPLENAEGYYELCGI